MIVMKNKKQIWFAAFLTILSIHAVISQNSVAWQVEGAKTKRLVQFSGVVIESDSLKPIPFASVIIQEKYRGTVSDYFGYFSFVAQVNDTIEFSAIGFQSAKFIIPDTLTSNIYSIIQVLNSDTVTLALTEVYPWPSREQFKHEFLKLNIPDDDLARAFKNMERDEMKQLMVGMAMDASLNHKYSLNQYQTKLYYAGQLPPNNLLNPIAWSKFIKAWQKGEFKKKK
jgi:hypothetical protein